MIPSVTKKIGSWAKVGPTVTQQDLSKTSLLHDLVGEETHQDLDLKTTHVISFKPELNSETCQLSSAGHEGRVDWDSDAKLVLKMKIVFTCAVLGDLLVPILALHAV